MQQTHAGSMGLPVELEARAVVLDSVGHSLASNGKYPAGIAMIRRAIANNPFEVNYRKNLATYLSFIGEQEEARRLTNDAIKEAPNSSTLWNLIAFLDTLDGDLEASIAHNRKAAELSPIAGKFKFDLACSLLRAGKFEEGWKLYEYRREVDDYPDPPQLPLWAGEKRRHIFVYGDQGVGDKVQFARFLPWVKDHAEHVTFALDPASLPLFYGYRDLVDLATTFDAAAGCDAQISLSALAGVYGARDDNLPPDPRLIEIPGTRGQLLGDGIKIGLVWSGNLRQANNNTREVPFTELLALGADPRNQLFSLQCGPRSKDIADARAQVLVDDLSGKLEGNWTATPAALKEMDLVVTVCTSVAHIAGALGVPTILLASRFSCWRWLWDRGDTPWYPLMKIVRQKRLNDWKPVVAEAVALISQIHRERALRAGFGAVPHSIVRPQQNLAAGSREGDLYEPEVARLMDRLLKPGDVYVDVGANVGLHVKRAANLIGPTGRVLAFDPEERNAEALSKISDQHGNVIFRREAVLDRGGDVTLHICAESSEGSALYDPGLHPLNDKSRAEPKSVIVAAITLDEAVLGCFKTPTLIKIDTEGAEQKVLEGAAGLLFERHPSFIVAELHAFGLMQFGHTQASLRSFMRKAGYTTFLMHADGSKPRELGDGEFIGGQWIVNILFSTREAVEEAWPGEIAKPYVGESAAA